jgi:hypothetical protein
MDADQVATLRALLTGTGWLDRARLFGRALRSSPRRPGGLLVVGTPDYEPWHLAAHLDDESRLSDVPELSPTLIRWSPPPGAPPHLAQGLARLEAARRGETLAAPAASVISFDAAQHLVSAAAGERTAAPAARGPRALRERLARLLDTVTGPVG